ncbi:MAG: 16S rRNA (adenine(1518)-N(6)/adenine(1519)-N(6))-dimethyltransferase RsmA [Candidatus Marsarchaeota archaeon]|nr:16S rRNA (adenine(1518)-N(6)/adenine(1519)-N(6))-dimethyltransferase RsmA [Candidatus Marsarchaeota archaeon]
MAMYNGIRPIKKLGQNFLVCEHIAELESDFSKDKKVIEIGPGMGMLTEKLCKKANSVLAVEYDKRLYELLIEKLNYKNLKLINDNFFRLNKSAFLGYNMLIANIPYNLSSKTIGWIIEMRLDAILCMQKELVEHMLANVSTNKYSKLSVISKLMLNVGYIEKVPAECFYPKPNVDSVIVYIKPKEIHIEKNIMHVISCIMEHKKKTLRNAIIDSSKNLGIDKKSAMAIAEQLDDKSTRVFDIAPNELLNISKKISTALEKLHK